MTVAQKKQPVKASPVISKKIAENVFDSSFWSEFAPDFNIEKAPEKNIIKLKDADKQRAKLIREGYIHLMKPGLKAPFKEMNALFDKMVENGVPPVFSFVYDEFWHLGTQLRNVLGGLLDENYLMLPDFWAWRVAPGQAGWTPHRDKQVGALFPDKTPKSLTVWMPLNQAHPLNGCMYVLPADRDVNYGTPNGSGFGGSLADIRALPGDAGDVFVWTQHVFHWGGHSADEHHLPPRMSVAFEFQRSDIRPFNAPLLEPGTVPSFDQRLALIAKQVMQYRHMYSFTPELVEIAARINDKLKLPPSAKTSAG